MKPNPNKHLTIFGVCHTAATFNETVKELDKFKLNSHHLVFIEPKKSILDGSLKCDDPNIMGFFKKLVEYLFKKGSTVVPLNPNFTPSHHNPLLYRKIAQQFAEEEYMVEIIASTKTQKQKIVIIGNIHAPRMRDLLKAKGFKVTYKRTSEMTPSDELMESWRKALLGRTKGFISMRWLTKFRDDLRERFSLPQKSNIPKIFYGDEKLYHQYLKEAHNMEVRGEEDKQKYLVKCDLKFIDETHSLKKNTTKLLYKHRKVKDHEEVKKNLIR